MTRLFDYTDFANDSESYRALIKKYASANAFRSAHVDELVLNDEYHRRPLRPEDFEFIRFDHPVAFETVSFLPSLASQRTLATIYELSYARSFDKAGNFAEIQDFYKEDVQVIGAHIAPFLEAFAFHYLCKPLIKDEAPEALQERLLKLVRDEEQHWEKTFDALVANNYLGEGLKFIMMQRWCLAPSQRQALDRAAVSGYFDLIPLADMPRYADEPSDTYFLSQIADFCGVVGKQHSYWQFYLSTSLAKCNLLYALGRRPDRAFAFIGASFVAEAEWLTFRYAVEKGCPHLKSQAAHLNEGDLRRRKLLERFSHALEAIQRAFGADCVNQFTEGVRIAEALSERARWDVTEQLRWLSAIESYKEFALKITERVERECPGIDRETFVEPFEMCSTTHVHSDHRLVTIENGDMLFWGNLGMKLQLNKGDTILIPEGRLHGSTVLSEICTYHQPIIPDEWVAELVRKLDAKLAA